MYMAKLIVKSYFPACFGHIHYCMHARLLLTNYYVQVRALQMTAFHECPHVAMQVAPSEEIQYFPQENSMHLHEYCDSQTLSYSHF